MKAAPYIILGVGYSVGISLIIGACISSSSALSLTLLIPTLFTGLLAFYFTRFLKQNDYDAFDSYDSGVITFDALTFFLVVFVVSTFYLPIVLRRCNKINNTTTLILDILGSIVIILVGLSTTLIKNDDDL